MSTGISAGIDDFHDLVSLLFIAVIPIDCNKFFLTLVCLLFCSNCNIW